MDGERFHSHLFLNGSFVSADQAMIPVTDRGFLFGDGVFTTLRVSQGRIEFWHEHLERLKKDAEQVRIALPFINLELPMELIKRNQAVQGLYRLKIILTPGEKVDLDKIRPVGNLMMTLQPYEETNQISRLAVYPQPVERPLATVKSLAYQDRFFISNFAFSQGFDDAVTVNSQGFLMETAFSNIFWKVDSQIYFPDPSLSFFEGVTIQVLKKIFAEQKLEMKPVKQTSNEIPAHAQLFCCNSLKGFQPVIALGDRTFSRDLNWEKDLSERFEIAKKMSISSVSLSAS